MIRIIYPRLGAPELKGDFMVDCPLNIGLNKALAIYGRFDPKSYVDLYFLKPFLNFDIMKVIELAKNKDAGIEAFQWVKVILDAENIRVLPRMLKEIDLNDLESFFH